ncbi:hypothetical protein BG000_007733 [Podila horticola]|nr:hypothetical protein BG000_007733 [Podila horticola]
MFGRQTSNSSKSTTKPSSGTTTPSAARSRTSSTAPSTSAKTPTVTKPGVAPKRNSLDPKALSSTPKRPLPPIKTTSFSATNTPTVRSPITAKPPARLPTQPSTPISGTRSALTSNASRNQLVKAGEPLKRTAPVPSKSNTARTTDTAPSTPTRDTARVYRSGSISGQSTRTNTPLTPRSATLKTAPSTKPASTNGARDPSRRSSIGTTPTRVGPPAKIQTSTLQSPTAAGSKTQTPVSSSPPTPRLSSRPSSMSLTSKDLPSLRETKTHTPTASMTSPIPSSSQRSSFSSSSSKSPATKVTTGPTKSLAVSSVPEQVLPAPPGERHVIQDETSDFKEASVDNEATPQIIPAQESDNAPQLASLSLPMEVKDGYNNDSENGRKAQNDDDGELQDKEQQHHQHQHQVSSTPPPSRTQESPPSPSTPTPAPTLQLFKEKGPTDLTQSIEQQEHQQQQESQPLHQNVIQIHYAMISNNNISELSKDESTETLYAPEPAPLGPIELVKESEISTVVKEDLPALESAVEEVIESTSISVIDPMEEVHISFTSAIEDLKQAEEMKQEWEQDQEDEEDEEVIVKAIEEEIVKAVEEVIQAKEESLEVKEEPLEVEENQVVEAEEEKKVAIAKEESVLAVEVKEDTQEQEQEDVKVTVQDDDIAMEEDPVSASVDVALLDGSEAVEEPLPATETLDNDQQPQVETEFTETIVEESVELEVAEESGLTAAGEPEFKVAEAPIEQEQTSTQQEVVETAQLEGVLLDCDASETVDSVVPISDEEIMDVCSVEEEVTPDILETVFVEQVEPTEASLDAESASLTESEAVTVEVQEAEVEENAIVEAEDVQNIEAAIKVEVATIESESESELTFEEAGTMKVLEDALVDEHEVDKSDIDAIEEEVVIKTTDDDVEDTEMAQSEVDSVEKQSVEEESKVEIAETIVDEHIEIQESAKDNSTEVEEVPEDPTEPDSSKKIEIDETALSFEESVESLEISDIESSFDEEFEVEKIIEKDEIPSELTVLETEAALKVSDIDGSSAEGIPLVIDQVDPTCVSYKFVWNHGGQSVKVTGTFNNWEAPVDLNKNDDAFEAIVDLDRTKMTHFKFVVDGQWLCASDLATEFDHSGNQNHVLYALV